MRIRFNGWSPKEILYRRNSHTNLPVEVNDEHVLKEQSEHRKKSSEASYKHKEKFKQSSPNQTFKIGDLVMLRDFKTKNTPRSTYLVDSFSENPSEDYILIRKLGRCLRPRLYKAKPEELIHMPTSARPQQDTSNPATLGTPAETLEQPFVLALKASGPCLLYTSPSPRDS